MLGLIGYKTLDELMAATVPASIRKQGLMNLSGLPTDRALGEHEVLTKLRAIADQNKVFKSYIGMGYSDTITPGVILRNILENPGWYTQYTPYQAEIAQGRLEALLNFQTMVADLTGLAPGRRVAPGRGHRGGRGNGDVLQHRRPGGGQAQNDVLRRRGLPPADDRGVRTRAESLGIEVVTGDPCNAAWSQGHPNALCGVLVQYPTTDGEIKDYAKRLRAAHGTGARWSWPPRTCWRSRCSRRRASGGPTSRGQLAAVRRANGLRRPARGVLSARATSTSASCRVASLACRATRTATWRYGWRSRRASSTSAVRRRRATSARRRCSWRSWPGCTRCYHGPRRAEADREARPSPCRVLAVWFRLRRGARGHHQVCFDTIRVQAGGDREREC
jgi:glycine dehydrogenase